MVHEFEGRTEKEAIDAAIRELGLERDGFDVEILESEAGGIFRKGHVKIRVHTAEAAVAVGASSYEGRPERPTRSEDEGPALPISGEFEEAVVGFTKKLIEGMGYEAEVVAVFREDRKLGLRIDSDNASILIGKKGKNLDALQLLVNVFAGKAGRDDVRVILDSENYRIRREESLVRLAYDTAEQVRRTRQSVLLEPMNPFERRIVHTTLNDIVDITTKSEGEGLYKQVRVHFRGRV
ncbi:MAG TPA: RNA-binding cell elongation regulator Jag/EloR [Rectinemataceae bacterium]|nr:RNA-binding cell elongation regulator Jag/EloR [Rectinemataceae bacterium]